MDEERVYLKVASDSSLETEDDDDDDSGLKKVKVRARKGSSTTHNSVLRFFINLDRCVAGIVMFILSLVTNLVLLGLLLSPKACCQERQCTTAPALIERTTTTTTTTTATTTSTTTTLAPPHPTRNAGQTVSSSNGVPDCVTSHPNLETYKSSAPRYKNVFQDLSSEEISAVYSYLSKSTGFQSMFARENSNDAYAYNMVYSIELHVPNKSAAVDYMNGVGSKPAREARVILERPDLPVPVLEEYVVGPLPNPNYHYFNPRGHKHTVLFRFHPQYGINEAYTALYQSISPELTRVVEESFGAKFENCSIYCLELLPQKTSTGYSDDVLVLFTAFYATDFLTINPVDLTFVMKEVNRNSLNFVVDMVYYGGRVFPSIAEFVQKYNSNNVTKIKTSYPRPSPKETSNPGTMNIRGRKFPALYQQGPKEFQPEGNRYIVTGQHVQYLEWSFYFRMSAAFGPQLWDVRWAGQRIAYEISLQEVAVLYAGANPRTFYSHLSDSAFKLGEKASGLVPGTDCPEHATFFSQTVYMKYLRGPVTLPNAFCLFEHNAGRPLRRHRSTDTKNGNNYGGLVDRVLILRSVIVEYNYDYIFDVVFHQNGAIEIKTYATGYIMSHVYNDGESPFGFRVHNNVVGSIHHHMMNFKIDLDILGQANRYETLDFVVDDRAWPWHRKGSESFKQLSFKHSLKRTEREAMLRYNFSTPKYHVVYNDRGKNSFGNNRAYRITAQGFTKQILPDDSPVLKSRQWSKYQMLVSKRKDEEESSSSIFSMLDGEDPHVDVDRYLKDDENIVDEDLVFWVTVGFHHIPHTEDIPNTPTVGAEATIALLPFNYFHECPSVGSRDALRFDIAQFDLQVQDYGVSNTSHCVPPKFDNLEMISNMPIL